MTTKKLVRSLADADPSYAGAKALVDRLSAQRAKLDNEESRLLEQLRNRAPTPERTSRVAALLGDEAGEDDGAPDGVSARLREIAAERVDMRAAIDIAQQRLTQARFGASKAICDELRPEYVARVKALAMALLAANEASSSLNELSEDLSYKDVAWTGHLPPMQAHLIFGHEGGRLGIWLHEAAAAGFIKKSDIPQELAR